MSDETGESLPATPARMADAIRVRRLQVLAIRDWFEATRDGVATGEAATVEWWCRKRGVTTKGMRKLYRSPEIRQALQDNLVATGHQVAQMASSMAVEKLRKMGPKLKARELVKIGEFGARLAAAAYGKPGSEVTVAVQVRLPEVGDRSPRVVEAVVRDAKAELGDLLPEETG